MAEQKAKVVKVGRGGPRGPRPKVQNPGKIFMRILRYVMECYRIQVVAVVICIFVSVFANVQGTLFMQTLIDGYILPLLKEQSSDFSGLAHAIARTAGFYGIGIVTAFAQARMMAYVTQGTLKRLRDEMFTHMQTLPIKYFDRNAHGDIMSLYTNDIDTLRQMISQSMPQLLNSGSKIFQGAVRHDDRNARLQPQLADGAHAVDMDWRIVPVFCRGVPESGNDLLKPVG